MTSVVNPFCSTFCVHCFAKSNVARTYESLKTFFVQFGGSRKCWGKFDTGPRLQWKRSTPVSTLEVLLIFSSSLSEQVTSSSSSTSWIKTTTFKEEVHPMNFPGDTLHKFVNWWEKCRSTEFIQQKQHLFLFGLQMPQDWKELPSTLSDELEKWIFCDCDVSQTCFCAWTSWNRTARLHLLTRWSKTQNVLPVRIIWKFGISQYVKRTNHTVANSFEVTL